MLVDIKGVFTRALGCGTGLSSRAVEFEANGVIMTYLPEVRAPGCIGEVVWGVCSVWFGFLFFLLRQCQRRDELTPRTSK